MALLPLQVTPRASADSVAGWQDGRLRVRLAAPPVDGAANEACLRLLAGWLGLRRSRLALRSGERSRQKLVEVEGLTDDELSARIAARL